MLLLQTATFLGGYAATFMGLRKSPCLRLPEIDSREPFGYGQRFVVVSCPMAVAHKENGGIRLSAKGKEKGICMKSMQQNRTSHSGGNLPNVIGKNLKKVARTGSVSRQGS